MSRFGSLGTQFFDDSGDPLSGGSITFYETGTTTEATTYSDEALTTANDNPVVLDAAGRQPNIFFAGQLKAVLKTSGGVIVETRDPVGDAPSASLLPAGGTTGQALTKASDDNYDVEWTTIAGGGGALWEFDTTVRTSAFTAETGKYYFTDTTSGFVEVTLPSSPTAGDVVIVRQVAGASTTGFAHTDDIENATDTPGWFVSLPTGSAPTDEQRYAGLVYLNATFGWVVFMGAVEENVI
jgi:hypothetical protein